MQVRIYRPARNAMQSGQAGSKQWVLEFPLMGWTTSDKTRQQVTLKFDSKEEAIAYAQREGYAYRVEEPAPRRLQVKAYSDNFRYDRIGSWTH